LPTLIRRKALRMLAVEKDAAAAFNELDPSATVESENGAS